jgi:hypothetical protein
MQPSLTIPEVRDQDGAIRPSGAFDVQQYFSVLDRLSMEAGYLLGFVYCQDPPPPVGGSPRLYARQADQEPFTACTEVPEPAAYLRHIETDGSEEGFFQLALLKVVAEQFYLYWHANYDDDRVICSQEAMETLFRTCCGPGRPLSSTQIAAARGIDATPNVEFGKDSVTVKLVTFTKWGGFFRETFEMDRDFPHAPLVQRKELLVEYQVGIIF